MWDAVQKTFSWRENALDLRHLQLATKLLLTINLVIILVVFAISREFTSLIGWLSLAASVFSVINLMLCDEGKITNYSWGIFESILFLVIDWQNRLIGDLATNLYYLVTQTLGIFWWGKELKQQTQQRFLQPRKLKKWQIGLVITGLVLLYLIVLFFSKRLHGTQIYLDACLLPLSVMGMLLMLGGYRSQWLIWIAWDVVSLIIWYRQFQVLSPASASMLALEVIKLVNGIYGAYRWFGKQPLAS
ncbi:nicotinamide riboside transporter PnuC [Fructilactobacillus cliffordii]|uniref:Nicotinamide riboside transporter PnuC n=1 Tax=Fructilactobacillus cliffordii TaxID=2940299 RepID=A0A9Q8ZUI4_9LACO|nr:nicotinamide riboside transporter PnuC [Fructilactobacillus cliffordii]USS88751.1 nicotinamide riboside transporter PnuC [Fructilactobacillus cliffordii]